jgi:hypothetical protein
MINKSSLAVPKKTRLRPAALTSHAMRRLFLSLLVLAAIWVGLAPLATVPAVVPATAPAAEFSAERAMRDLASSQLRHIRSVHHATPPSATISSARFARWA